MMVALLVALVVGVVSPAPVPSPTNPFTLTPGTPAPQLPTIGRTRSRSLCTGIRRSIVPALEVAKKNAVTFTDARAQIFKYTVQNEGIGKDYVLFRLDQKTLGDMQKNIDKYDQLLADPALVPLSSVNPDDQKLIVDLKKRATLLRQVQSAEMNVLSGFLETERFNRYKQPSETEAGAQHALGIDNLPGASGDQKIMNDYYNYFHDPRGTNQLANARAIDDDLGSIAAVGTNAAGALQTLAADAVRGCRY